MEISALSYENNSDFCFILCMNSGVLVRRKQHQACAANVGKKDILQESASS